MSTKQTIREPGYYWITLMKYNNGKRYIGKWGGTHWYIEHYPEYDEDSTQKCYVTDINEKRIIEHVD